MNTKTRVQDIIAQIGSLPTLPQVARQLMRMVNDKETSALSVAHVVETDQSLATRVLRLANSAFYGMPRAITTTHNAVVVLGFKAINTLVFSLTVFDMFPEDKIALFNRKQFWRHSLACAIIAKFLSAQQTGPVPVDPEEAFCSGLLHDIGKVIMEQYLHHDFRKALTYAHENKICFYKAEHTAIGITHTDVAGWLIDSWALPEQLRTPVVFHHTPAKAHVYRHNAMICHYADWLCHQAGEGLYADAPHPELEKQTLSVLDFGPDIVDVVKEMLTEELKRAEIFSAIMHK